MTMTTAYQEAPGTASMKESAQEQQYWEMAELHRSELINQAFAILNSREDAEDVVQETFCEAIGKADKVAPAALGPLLRTINRCNALNRQRDRGRARARISRRQAAFPTRSFTTGGFSGIEVRESVQKQLRTLPENLRQIVVMRYWEQLSYKEIGERLRIPPKSVGPLLSQAELMLYPELESHLKSAPRQQPKIRPGR